MSKDTMFAKCVVKKDEKIVEQLPLRKNRKRLK